MDRLERRSDIRIVGIDDTQLSNLFDMSAFIIFAGSLFKTPIALSMILDTLFHLLFRFKESTVFAMRTFTF